MVSRSEVNRMLLTGSKPSLSSVPVSVVAYSFKIINWKMSDINGLDTKTLKLLTVHRIHSPGYNMCCR